METCHQSATMFQYETLPLEVQTTKKCTIHSDYVTVLYLDPAPIFPNWTPQPIWMPDTFKAAAEDLKNFKVRDDDVWILSYAKTGTTITCELVSLLMSNCDFQHVDETHILTRIPYLE